MQYPPSLLSQLLATFLIQFERLRGVQSSGVLFIFWFLSVLCAIVPFRSKILQASSQVRTRRSPQMPFTRLSSSSLPGALSSPPPQHLLQILISNFLVSLPTCTSWYLFSCSSFPFSLLLCLLSSSLLLTFKNTSSVYSASTLPPSCCLRSWFRAYSEWMF